MRVFERTPAGLAVTPDGRVVLDAARDLVVRHEQLRADLANRLDPDTGIVRLAFLDSMATTLVPKLLRAFHAEAPAVKVVLSQEPAHDIRSDLDRGAVELGLTMDRAEDLGWLAVQRERLVVVVPPTHRFRDRTRIDLAALADDELVTTPPGFGHSALVRRCSPRPASAPGLLRERRPGHDRGTGGRRARGRDRAGGVRRSVRVGGARAIMASATRTIGLTWRTDRPLAPPAKRFLAFVRAGRRPTDAERGCSALARAEQQPAAALRGFGIAGAGHHPRLIHPARLKPSR